MNLRKHTTKSLLPDAASHAGRSLPVSLARCVVLLAALALLAAPVVAAGAAGKPHAKKAAATVAISKVTVNGQKVTVTGRVTPPASAARLSPTKAVVLLTLKGAGKSESFGARPNHSWRFTATKVTKLVGHLTVTARLEIAGKATGGRVKKTFEGPVVHGAGSGGSAGKGTGPAGPATPSGPSSAVGTPLLGLFKLEPGTQAVSGAVSGSYFKMVHQGNAVFNGSSPFGNQEYTPLLPGSDAGLSTVAYQPAPVPSFASAPSGGLGDCLASRVTQPQPFYNIGFGIATDPTARNGYSGEGGTEVVEEPAPLPSILDNNGALSGQTTAWTACWAGGWFNQGAPKPDGTYAVIPGTTAQWNFGGTTPVTGTYDAVTGHFTLKWQSLIVGGAFSNYTGQWNLEGTFVPAS